MSEIVKVRILLIRSWLHAVGPLRAALQSAGFEPRFTRVDIEPALNAALLRGGYDVIVYDPKVPGMTRELVETRLREHGAPTPIIFEGEPAELVARIVRAWQARQN